MGMTPVCAATTDRKEKDAINLDMVSSECVPQRIGRVLGWKRVDVQMDKVRKKDEEKEDLTVSPSNWQETAVVTVWRRRRVRGVGRYTSAVVDVRRPLRYPAPYSRWHAGGLLQSWKTAAWLCEVSLRWRRARAAAG